MPTRQILRRLATASAQPSSSSSAATSASATAAASLAPPYAHSLSAPTVPSSAFRPPYAHSNNAVASSSRHTLKAPLRFSLIPTSTPHDATRTESFNTWARGLLATEQGREVIWRRWVESVIALEHAKSAGNRIPEVRFHALAAHLQAESTRAAVRATGAIVVRDVVADAEAQGWAREILQEMDERQGRPVYWHDALLAARAHTSVLSANNQLLAALTGHEGEAFVQADTAQVGAGSAGARTTSLDDVWAVDTNSIAPSTPLLSHLALTASSPGSLPPTIHAAVYASLRPLFTPARSKISFYDETSYLDPANWRLVDSPELPTYAPAGTPAFPHLAGASVALPRLQAGDMVLRHSAVPIASGAAGDEQGIFVPVSPLPRSSANETYVQQQRLAFEQGLPPAHARAEGDGLVALERDGAREMIASRGGKRAMGYA